MLREVKIHDSALLPKVQFNPGRKGRAGGEAEGEEEDGQIFLFFFMTVLISSWKLGWYFIEPNVKFYTEPLKRPNSTLELENYNYS